MNYRWFVLIPLFVGANLLAVGLGQIHTALGYCTLIVSAPVGFVVGAWIAEGKDYGDL